MMVLPTHVGVILRKIWIKKGYVGTTHTRGGDPGIKFDSKKECNRYIELSRLASTGCISDLRLQVPFVLQETFKDNTGRTERSIKYLADFVYSKAGQIYVEDVKSPITRKEPTYIIKRKLFKYKYPEYTFIEV